MACITVARARRYDPLIVFAFGKNKCEKLAGEVMKSSSLQLITPDESTLVEQIFKNAIETLSEDDQALPQVGQLLPMVLRGVAVHHSGLLPLLKEVRLADLARCCSPLPRLSSPLWVSRHPLALATSPYV